MVFDDHDVSNLEVLIEASSCVCKNDRLDAEQFENAHW